MCTAKRTRGVWSVGAALGGLLALSAAPMATAAVHDVGVGPNLDFLPPDITIAVGDTVRWTWLGGLHNVESGVGGVHDGNFRSGDPTMVVGTVYEVVFDQAFLDAHPMPGDHYPYYCSVHFFFGMTGSVTVTAPCPADLNGDNAVDVLDLLDVLAAWGGPGGVPADLNGDGSIDVLDLLQLLAAWGPCG